MIKNLDVILTLQQEIKIKNKILNNINLHNNNNIIAKK